MNTRCTLPARLAALVLLLAALVLVPAAGHAQTINCNTCDHFTFAVSPNLNCAVTICYSHSQLGPVICETVKPGTSIVITCPIYQAWVNTCSGRYFLVPGAAANCTPDLKFAADCCGHICNVPSADLCSRLEAQPVPCATPGCP
ncbi:MAG: hypothetical protein JST22_09630 [Bacteroidetes bacterium]|nr:hypothetical protein [Bacteroidota bacterium]